MCYLRYVVVTVCAVLLLACTACSGAKSQLDSRQPLLTGAAENSTQALAPGEMPPFPKDEAASGMELVDSGTIRGASFRPAFFDVFVDDPYYYWGGMADWADPGCFWLFSDPRGSSFSYAVWRCEVKDWFPSAQPGQRQFNLLDCFPVSLNFNVFCPWQFDGTAIVGIADFRYHNWVWRGMVSPPEAQVDFWEGHDMNDQAWGRQLNESFISNNGNFYFAVLTNGSSLKICEPVLHMSFFDVFTE